MSSASVTAQTETPADVHLREQREEVAIETAGMAAAYNALQPLGHHARARALHWLARALESSVDVPF